MGAPRSEPRPVIAGTGRGSVEAFGHRPRRMAAGWPVRIVAVSRVGLYGSGPRLGMPTGAAGRR
jgi:hypothetical protein